MVTLHHLCHSEIETCFSDSPEDNFKYVYSVRKLSEDQVKSCINKQVLASTPGRLKVHLSVWPWELLELPSKKKFLRHFPKLTREVTLIITEKCNGESLISSVNSSSDVTFASVFCKN